MSTPIDPPLPPPIDQPRRKKRSGLRTVIYVVAAIGGLMVLTCGAIAFFVFQQPGVRETFEAAMQAGSAPGTEALREMGCQNAAVMDMAAAIEGQVVAQGEEMPEGVPTLFVICQVVSGGAEVGCDEVSAAYIGEVGEAPTPYVVQVTRGFTGQDACQVAYQADGTRIGTLEEAIRQHRDEAQAGS